MLDQRRLVQDRDLGRRARYSEIHRFRILRPSGQRQQAIGSTLTIQSAQGVSMQEDMMATTDPAIDLMRLINGYQVSQALHAAATLGVAEQLVEGPKSSDALAQTCGANPTSLYRLLRALAAIGVFHEAENKEFSLTPMGFLLVGSAPRSARDYARWIGTPGQWRAWGNLLHSIQSGRSAVEFTHGTDAWTYRSQHPEERSIFDSAMAGNSRSEAIAVLDAYDFSRFGCIVDIGGGQGILLKTVLLACPSARGILFDQPRVIASADQALSSGELSPRCELIGGSFFESSLNMAMCTS